MASSPATSQPNCPCEWGHREAWSLRIQTSASFENSPPQMLVHRLVNTYRPGSSVQGFQAVSCRAQDNLGRQRCAGAPATIIPPSDQLSALPSVVADYCDAELWLIVTREARKAICTNVVSVLGRSARQSFDHHISRALVLVPRWNAIWNKLPRD